MERARKPKKAKVQEPIRKDKNMMSEEAQEAAGKIVTDVFYGILIGAIWFGIYMFLGKFGVNEIVSALILAAVPFAMTALRPAKDFMAVAGSLLEKGDFRDRQESLEASAINNSKNVTPIVAFVLMAVSFYLLMSYNLTLDGVWPIMGPGLALVFIPAFARYIASTEILKRPQLSFSKWYGFFLEKKGIGKYVFLMMLVPVIVIAGIAIFAGVTSDHEAYLFCLEVMLIQIVASWLANSLVRNSFCGVSEQTRNFAIVMDEVISVIAIAIIISI